MASVGHLQPFAKACRSTQLPQKIARAYVRAIAGIADNQLHHPSEPADSRRIARGGCALHDTHPIPDGPDICLRLGLLSIRICGHSVRR